MTSGIHRRGHAFCGLWVNTLRWAGQAVVKEGVTEWAPDVLRKTAKTFTHEVLLCIWFAVYSQLTEIPDSDYRSKASNLYFSRKAASPLPSLPAASPPKPLRLQPCAVWHKLRHTRPGTDVGLAPCKARACFNLMRSQTSEVGSYWGKQ